MNPEGTPPVPTGLSQPAASRPGRSSREELPVMQPGEEIICQIRRHPIGIITNYAVSGLVLVIILVIMLAILPRINPDNSQQINLISTSLFIVILVIGVLFNLIATKVYWENRWIVTSDSITQIDQDGLFTRQTSQLSLDDIEDVTAEQNGLLTHIFDFGVLKAETAGEHSKFVFIFCPTPTLYAQKILAAREAFEQHDPPDKRP